MGVRTPEAARVIETPRQLGPPLTAALGLAVLLWAALLSNGRPIGAGDTRATERVAASLVQEGDFTLDEYPEIEDPFARNQGGHRVSIYPVFSAVLASPIFFISRFLFVLDENGTAWAGKLSASLFSALAAGALFLAVGCRRPQADATWTAVLFALGTSVWSTSQGLWQHPAAVLSLAVALLFVTKAEDDAVWAGRAGLPLACALAARHADLALVGVLALGVLVRWPGAIPRFLLWAAPPALFVLGYNASVFGSPVDHGFSGALGRFSAPWGIGHLGLLLSPAKGLLVFTPLVLLGIVGLARAYRRGERWLAITLGGAVAGHWLLTGRWSEWHGGESWGPRLMTDALPLLFLLLPEGLDLLPRLGRVLALLSVFVQGLGAFAYDYRWERLYQRAEAAGRELWEPARSPILFYAQRRVLWLALPGLRDGKLVVREHPLVLLGPQGSRVRFGGEGAKLSGTDSTLGDVFLERGARVEGDRLRLKGRWSGLFLRVLPHARTRVLELRIAGRGHGPLYVSERSFWVPPRFTTHTMSGTFVIRSRYVYAESGGPDLSITLGRGGGEASLEWVALVAPSDPLAPIERP